MMELEGYDALMRQLERIEQGLRKQAVRRVAEAMGNVVAKRARQLCPPPGYEGDKAGLKPLRDTIAVEVRDYGDRHLAVIGPAVPAGAHGRLVEDGHAIVRGGQTVGRAAPHPFMRPAFDETKGEQQAAGVAKAKQMVELLAAGSA